MKCLAALGSMVFAAMNWATGEAHLQVVSNPHVGVTPVGKHFSDSAQTCSLPVLDPATIIQTPMPVQPDTFRSVTPVEYLGNTVPVYRFQQPARLSPKELPFSIVNVESIGWVDNVVAVSVSPEKAADSWVSLFILWAVLLLLLLLSSSSLFFSECIDKISES